MYGRPATHAHSFAEVLLRKGSLSENRYNFDVAARAHIGIDPVTQLSVMKSYFAKLVHGHRGCLVSPVLFLGRYDDGATVGCDTNGNPNPAYQGAAVVIPTADPLDKCDEIPPLALGGAVLLRIEADDNIDGYPLVKATVAWGTCTGGIETCEHVCTVSRLDVGDPKLMSGILGEWVFTGHDVTHLLEFFRAGSEPSP